MLDDGPGSLRCEEEGVVIELVGPCLPFLGCCFDPAWCFSRRLPLPSGHVESGLSLHATEPFFERSTDRGSDPTAVPIELHDASQGLKPVEV